MEEERIKSNIAKNLTAYRKRCNLTQSQLAEKINYSDKAVSKWERGEGVPDTLVLLKMCEIFENDRCNCHEFTYQEYASRSLKIRIKEQISRLLSPLL